MCAYYELVTKINNQLLIGCLNYCSFRRCVLCWSTAEGFSSMANKFTSVTRALQFEMNVSLIKSGS